MYECHPPDTQTEVRFYGPEFYCLSNFSAFRLVHEGIDFMTSEHAYHWEKFKAPTHRALSQREHEQIHLIRRAIIGATSAHEALMISRRHEKMHRREDWPDVRLNVMREILVEKLRQHEYVMRKLMQTGDRQIIEDSWRDAYWGIGKDGHGENMLGKLWMEIRSDLRRRVS